MCIKSLTGSSAGLKSVHDNLCHTYNRLGSMYKVLGSIYKGANYDLENIQNTLLVLTIIYKDINWYPKGLKNMCKALNGTIDGLGCEYKALNGTYIGLGSMHKALLHVYNGL